MSMEYRTRAALLANCPPQLKTQEIPAHSACIGTGFLVTFVQLRSMSTHRQLEKSRDRQLPPRALSWMGFREVEDTRIAPSVVYMEEKRRIIADLPEISGRS